MAVPQKPIRRLRLTRSILLNGDHAEEGSIHDVPRALAQILIGEGSAESFLAEGEAPEPAPTTVNRMEHVSERDPRTAQVAPAPPKVKK